MFGLLDIFNPIGVVLIMTFGVWGRTAEGGQQSEPIFTYFLICTKYQWHFFFSVAVEKSILYLPLKLTLIWGMHSFIMELFHFLGKQKKGHFGLV